MRIEFFYTCVDLAHALGRYLMEPATIKSLHIHMSPYGAVVFIESPLPGFVTARELQDLERVRGIAAL
jgi:hypothetical protein